MDWPTWRCQRRREEDFQTWLVTGSCLLGSLNPESVIRPLTSRGISTSALWCRPDKKGEAYSFWEFLLCSRPGSQLVARPGCRKWTINWSPELSVLDSTLLSVSCSEFQQGINRKGVLGKAGRSGHSLGPGFDTNLIWSKSRGTIQSMIPIRRPLRVKEGIINHAKTIMPK